MLEFSCTTQPGSQYSRPSGKLPTCKPTAMAETIWTACQHPSTAALLRRFSERRSSLLFRLSLALPCLCCAYRCMQRPLCTFIHRFLQVCGISTWKSQWQIGSKAKLSFFCLIFLPTRIWMVAFLLQSHDFFNFPIAAHGYVYKDSMNICLMMTGLHYFNPNLKEIWLL